MSDKFFFKGRQTPKPAYGQSGYNTKRASKLGSALSPLNLSVQNEQRKTEVEIIVAENQLYAEVIIDAENPENILELTGILNKPSAVNVVTKPNRNEVCPCGSGKKYKKCCDK